MRYLILLFSCLFTFSLSAQLTDWDWRQEVAIKNKSNTNNILPGASYFLLNGDNLVSNNKIKADFSDLRLSLDCDGNTLLDHWVENPGATDSVIVWVNYNDTIFPSSEVRLFAFYGNSAATDVADFDAVFPNQVIFTEDGTLDDATTTDWFEIDSGVTVTGGTADILYNITARRVRIDGTLDLTGLGEQTSIAASATGSGTGGDGFGGGGGGYGGDGAPGFDADGTGDPGAPGLAQGDNKAPTLDTAHAGGHGYVGFSDPLLGANFVPTFDGGNGGGRLFISASYVSINELIIDGAEGTGADQGGVGVGLGTALNGNPASGGGGGGAGGGLIIQSSLLLVNGDLSLDGGVGGDVPSTSEGTGGGGSGGRLKVFADFIKTNGRATVNGGGGGSLGNGNQTANAGNPGTLYFDSTTVNNMPTPELIVETKNGVFFEDPVAPNYVECRGVEVTFTATDNYSSYAFFVNNQLVQSGPNQVYKVDTLSVDASIYIVASTGTCTNTSDTIIVDVLTGPLSEFFPAGFNLTYNMDNFSKDATSYSWDFGDGTTSTDFEPQHKYAQPDSFTVCLTAINPQLQCTSHTTCQRIGVVCNPPGPGFVQTINGLRVEFRDLSDFATSFFWDFGDGTTSTEKSPTHDFLAAGQYQVTCTYTNECGTSSITKTITVDCNFQASFEVEQVPNTLNVKLTNTTPAAQTSNWDFGDGTTSSSGKTTTHSYSIISTYNVCLSSISSCGAAVVCEMVSLSCVEPTVEFEVTSVDTVATFDATFANNVGAPQWNFGDGNTSNIEDPVHAYAKQGEYNVCLSVQNSCSQAIACENVIIDCPNPDAFFDFEQDGYTFQFNDRSVNASSWRWKVGENDIRLTEQNPTYTYRDDTTRTYIVCLTVVNNCRESDQYCEEISLKKKPEEPDTTVTGIKNLRMEDISIFPNPVSSVLSVESDAKITGLKVLGISGVEYAVRIEEQQVFVEELAPGMYYLQVEISGGQKLIHRFVKE